MAFRNARTSSSRITFVTTVVSLAVALLAPSSGAAQTSLDGTPPDTRAEAAPAGPAAPPRAGDRPAAENRSSHVLPLDIAGDIWRFFSMSSTYATLGGGLAASMSVRPLDTKAVPAGAPASTYDPDPDDVFKPGNVLGGTPLQFGAAISTYGIGTLAKWPGVADLGRDLLRAQLLAGGFAQLLKLTVKRTRPHGDAQTSFPSGHTAGSFASATVLTRHYGWKAGVPAYAVASYVAASRIGHSEHYLSDVVFGAAIGLTAGRTVTFDHGRTKIELSPMARHQGIGLQVSVFRTSASGAM